MQKIIKGIPLLLLVSGIAHASYQVVIDPKPSVTSASIQFVNPVEKPINPEPEEPSNGETVYGNWTNVGTPYNCSSGTPLEEDVTSGETYTKTFSGCSQNQERTATTNNVTTTESKVITGVTYTAESVGTNINDCRYDLTNNNFVSRFSSGSLQSQRWYAITFYWEGVNIGRSPNKKSASSATSYTLQLNGYTYSVGKKVTYNATATFPTGTYYVCRKPS